MFELFVLAMDYWLVQRSKARTEMHPNLYVFSSSRKLKELLVDRVAAFGPRHR